MPKTLNFAKKIFSAKDILKIEPVNRFTKRHKIVVFSPPGKVDELTFAMSKAGAGKIGEYTVCSFRSAGEGTFKGSKDSKPFVGTKENFEKAEEIRLEMICDTICLNSVISEMLRVHPYEEPAYEIYDVVAGEKIRMEKALKVILKNPISIKELISKLNKDIDKSSLTIRSLNKKIKKFVIDFTGEDGLYELNRKSYDALYIIHSKKGEYKIKF